MGHMENNRGMVWFDGMKNAGKYKKGGNYDKEIFNDGRYFGMFMWRCF